MPALDALVVCNLCFNPPDEVIFEEMDRLFLPFGKIENIKTLKVPRDRVAYVYFRHPEDAQDAYERTPRSFELFGRAVRVFPFYRGEKMPDEHVRALQGLPPLHFDGPVPRRGGPSPPMDDRFHGGGGGARTPPPFIRHEDFPPPHPAPDRFYSGGRGGGGGRDGYYGGGGGGGRRSDGGGGGYPHPRDDRGGGEFVREPRRESGGGGDRWNRDSYGGRRGGGGGYGGRERGGRGGDFQNGHQGGGGGRPPYFEGGGGGGYRGGGGGGGHGGYRGGGGGGYGGGGGGGGYHHQQQPHGFDGGFKSGGGGGGGFRRFEDKPPEFDERANRQLVASDLDPRVTEKDLIDAFNKFGSIVKLSLRHPIAEFQLPYLFPGFITYESMDVAYAAKKTMNGTNLNGYKLAVRYNKVIETSCLCVCNLKHEKITLDLVEYEFDRFGAIKRIFWPEGKTFAYVCYESQNASVAAAKEMRGSALVDDGGARLQIEFVDPDYAFTGAAKHASSDRLRSNPERHHRDKDSSAPPPGVRGSSASSKSNDKRTAKSGVDSADETTDAKQLRDVSRSRGGSQSRSRSPAARQQRNGPGSDDVTGGGTVAKRRHDSSPPPLAEKAAKKSKLNESSSCSDANSDSDESEHQRGEKPKEKKEPTPAAPVVVTCIAQAMRPSLLSWEGPCVLKSGAFGMQLYHIGGNKEVGGLIPSCAAEGLLKITQRLRLDASRLGEVTRRISSAGADGHCTLIATPGSGAKDVQKFGNSLQQRPLKSLVSYLKSKEAAGVIYLGENGGVVHAFPPCEYAFELVKNYAPQFVDARDDFMVLLVVKTSPVVT